MSILKDLNKLKNPVFTISFLSLLLLPAPGVIFIFYLDKSLFLQLDTLKLVILSLALITPLIVINFFTLSEFLENKIQKESENYLFLMLSILYASIQLYCVLIVSYIGKFDFKHCLIALGVSIPVAIFLAWTLKFSK